MPNPWDADPVVSGNPWDADPVVGAPPDFSNVQSGVTTQSSRQPNNSLFRMDSGFRKRTGLLGGHMAVAAGKDMFGSRQGAAEYLAQKINAKQGLSALMTGGAKVVQADNGEPAIRLADGTTYRMNDPGLDSTDIGNVAGNIAAFFTPASWASRLGQARNIGVAGRAALQAGVAGATDAGLQAAFNNGNIDLGRTASAAAGGAGGEVLGTAIGAGASRIAASRRSTAEAGNIAKRLGIDATQDRVPALASAAEEVRAGGDPRAILGREKFGFQYTQGQRTADPVRRFDQLSREELLRQSPGAGGVFDAANRANRERLGEAVDTLGQRLGGRPGATPAELAQGAAGRVQQQAAALDARIGEAYEKAGQGARTAVGVDAVSTLPDRLRAAVADFGVDPQLHPAASKTLAQIREAADQVAQGDIKGVTLKAIETQRRIINNNVSAASNASDRAATLAIKREFDGWLDDAVENALVSGDPAALQALKDARALRTEFGRRFEGKEQADKFITGLLDGSRTPEELVNIALGAGQVSKDGGARFIERLRLAADNDPEVIGALRAAHFQRLALGRNGEPLDMGKIVSNIKATEYNNASILRALYSVDEWAQIRMLADALDPLIAKGDMARTSGIGERVARMMMSRMTGGIPVLGDMIVKPLQAGRAYTQANSVLNKPLRLRAQAPAGSQAGVAGVAEEYSR